ncbi:MAG: hypothetical protein Q4D98_09720 [Planctomycetia bacterium]|nr:hypothetical protein [Planctomycetia bacterium]
MKTRSLKLPNFPPGTTGSDYGFRRAGTTGCDYGCRRLLHHREAGANASGLPYRIIRAVNDLSREQSEA